MTSIKLYLAAVKIIEVFEKTVLLYKYTKTVYITVKYISDFTAIGNTLLGAIH